MAQVQDGSLICTQIAASGLSLLNHLRGCMFDAESIPFDVDAKGQVPICVKQAGLI